MKTPGQRIQWALRQRGITAARLAAELGITRSAVSQWWQKTKPTKPDARYYPKIVQLGGQKESWLRTGRGEPLYKREVSGNFMLSTVRSAPHDEIKTMGEIGANVWLPVAEFSDMDFEREPSAFPPVPGYPVEAQYDLIVRGTSINRFAADGQRVRCVSLLRAGIDFRDGDLVHVERYRRGRSEIERTIKMARSVQGKWELHFYSIDPRWMNEPPLQLGDGDPDTEVVVVGVALFQFAPAPARRRPVGG